MSFLRLCCQPPRDTTGVNLVPGGRYCPGIAHCQKSQKPKKSEKNCFWGYVPEPRGYLGHEFGMPGCPIVIRRYMQKLIKILRAVFEKFEVFQKVGIEKKRIYRWNSTRNKFRVLKKSTAAIVFRNKFPVLKIYGDVDGGLSDRNDQNVCQTQSYFE